MLRIHLYRKIYFNLYHRLLHRYTDVRLPSSQICKKFKMEYTCSSTARQRSGATNRILIIEAWGPGGVGNM